MAQQVKVLVTKSDDLNDIPRTHLVEGENGQQKDGLCLQTGIMAHVYTHKK